MGWGQVPSEAKVAEDARREALERAQNRRPMTPFERQILAVVEGIRVALCRLALAELPAPTGMNALLSAAPEVLKQATDAGGAALATAVPSLGHEFTDSGLTMMAEVVIRAAMTSALQASPPAAAETPDSGAAGGPTVDCALMTQQFARHPADHAEHRTYITQPPAGLLWQVICDQCGPVSGGQEYKSDAVAIGERHEFQQGFEVPPGIVSAREQRRLGINK
jgi:hypothetical protein